MNREGLIDQLRYIQVWDIIVIGGGATGLGVAMDAAIRGYKTLLLEQADFAKGTSSRSTKLVHGGVRYLAHGHFSLVFEALRERGLLLKNAAHLVSNVSFIIPVYTWWESLYYTIGLKLYDFLAGQFSLGSSKYISKHATIAALPNIKTEGLKGGVIYHDGQFDDARLAINIAQTAVENGACVLNYIKVTDLLKDNNGKIAGVTALDVESGQLYTLKAKAVVNATGVFVDNILKMENATSVPQVQPSRGTHLVLDSTFMPGNNALMIPKTSDNRVLFAVPWHTKLIVGTTDTLQNTPELEPLATADEVDFILDTAGKYFKQKPTRADVQSVFAGLRPLAASKGNNQSTKEISRRHKLIQSETGLITITGGKWTTFRLMAEDTVNAAMHAGKLPPKPCQTKHYLIHGNTSIFKRDSNLALYGSDAATIEKLMHQQPELAQKIHPKFQHTKAEVVWAVRHEMARTVEDVLARRLRILFLDARAAVEAAPVVARLLAKELQKDQTWSEQQITSFKELAQHYILQTN